MKTPEIKEEWEAEFDRRFVDSYTRAMGSGKWQDKISEAHAEDMAKVKTFIHELIVSERRRTEKIIKEMHGHIDFAMYQSKNRGYDVNDREREANNIVNHALSRLDTPDSSSTDMNDWAAFLANMVFCKQ